MARFMFGTRREIDETGAPDNALFSKSHFVRGPEYLTPELHPAVARSPAYHIAASLFWLNLPPFRLIFRAWARRKQEGSRYGFLGTVRGVWILRNLGGVW